mmetsp:Transcript_183494/g.582048  ORF Transcript_183494/g.582048 Transcript_183494/m.582048 type:complete len:157 (+) Transcript_183494:45-515(+)
MDFWWRRPDADWRSHCPEAPPSYDGTVPEETDDDSDSDGDWPTSPGSPRERSLRGGGSTCVRNATRADVAPMPSLPAQDRKDGTSAGVAPLPSLPAWDPQAFDALLPGGQHLLHYSLQPVPCSYFEPEMPPRPCITVMLQIASVWVVVPVSTPWIR